MNTDPISDMLARIRNAAAASKETVLVPYSKIKESIAKILQAHGYICGYSVEGEGTAKSLLVELKISKASPAITTLARISKPGRRIYAASKDIPTALNGRGIVIVSTPQGLMTGREARRVGLGGELICKVW